jgi:hypothetical protein
MALGLVVIGQRREDDVLTRLAAPVAVGAFVVAFAGVLAVLVQRVPVEASSLPQRVRMQHWPFAVLALVIVSAVDGTALAVLRRRPRPAGAADAAWFKVLLVLGLLQVGHLAEHSIQVGQLLATDGSLDRSHGLVGQLDFETVHFVWDSAVWLLLAVLLARFRHNRWLWVSFAAASVHEVEHLYLFYVYLMHQGFYFDGGFAGIMGRNGLIGTPLFRPYLHFAYNVVVIVPLAIAVWFEARTRPLAQLRLRALRRSGERLS